MFLAAKTTNIASLQNRKPISQYRHSDFTLLMPTQQKVKLNFETQNTNQNFSHPKQIVSHSVASFHCKSEMESFWLWGGKQHICYKIRSFSKSSIDWHTQNRPSDFWHIMLYCLFGKTACPLKMCIILRTEEDWWIPIKQDLCYAGWICTLTFITHKFPRVRWL